MSDGQRKSPFPRGALIGAAILLGFVLSVVGFLRWSGTEPAAQVETQGEPVAARALRFEDRPDGNVVVYEAADSGGGRRIAVFKTGEGQFIRGILRALTRQRRKSDIGHEQPFRLVQYADGALVLIDTATGETLDLRAFGATNTKAFKRLLPDEGRAQ